MPEPQKIYAGSTLIYESPVTTFPQQVETSTSAGVTVTGDATANTKGAWTELIASNDATSDWLLVDATQSANGNGVDTSYLLDIGTGASGSETVRIADIFCGYRPPSTGGRRVQPFLFPLRVASGTRIAARAQGAVGSRAGTVTIATLSGAARSSMPTTLDTIGADTAASRGTNLPTSNTYVQLTASTSRAYQALVVLQAGSGTSFNAVETSTFTIATGASGSEVDVYSVDLSTTNVEILHTPAFYLSSVYVGDIPAGTRLAAKQSIGRANRDVIVYGVPYA